MTNQNALKDFFHTTTTQVNVDVKVPGKLYISGEYAILFPQQPAILIAVDQYLRASITQSAKDQSGEIHTDLAELENLNFTIMDDQYDFASNHSSGWLYVKNAMVVASELLSAMGIKLKSFKLTFHSNLVHDNGVKLGLGSSGAVVVATIKSLLAFHGIQASNNLMIFKLAAIALIRSQSNGSLGDVAIITHGGWVYYQSFDRQWLKHLLTKGDVSVSDLLLTDWPELMIENLKPSDDLSLLIGWTQSAASTESLVAKLLQQVHNDDLFFKEFLTKSKESVNELRDAIVSNELNQVQAEIQTYRQLLQSLGEHYQISIETNLLTELIESAQQFGYASKSSGAGGGDCGIAIGSKDLLTQPLIENWKQQGILNLALQPTSQF
ncbi:phosphomevalonate kinase [Aerococcaceae bacterium WGS1372]